MTSHYRALEASSGVPVVYRPGGSVTSCEVTLIPGQSVDEELAVDEEEISARSNDWLVLVDVFAEDVGEEPAIGDEIDLIDGDQKTTFRVTSFDGRPWRYTDQHRVAYRIHSVEIATDET